VAAAGTSATAPGPGAIPTRGPESTTGAHDLPVLEAYRGLAAIMVVLTHVGFSSGAGLIGPWAGWLARLDFGVALFFLLSGFLLFRPFVLAAYGRRAPVAIGAYLRRRVVRIYPALLVAIAGNFLLTPEARKQGTALWVETIFLVQNYPSAFVTQLQGLVQLWSLVVEVSFYAALPVLAWVLVGLPRRGAFSNPAVVSRPGH
jgi:peptidoglycan/LPS O-acetylase OafA/YrhL